MTMLQGIGFNVGADLLRESFRGNGVQLSFWLVRTLLRLLVAVLRSGFAARRSQKPKQKRSDKSERSWPAGHPER